MAVAEGFSGHEFEADAFFDGGIYREYICEAIGRWEVVLLP
jgi:hypothetical protein